MSGGFFRGTSADQDTRFSNKQAKLLKSQKFAAELEHLVDMTKVKMDVLRPWIASRVTELLGFEDEVLINFIYGLLDGKEVNGKEVQISLTGFMEKNTGKFMKELWALLLSAQKNASGVPQQFLDAKAEETRKKKAETDRITSEIQRKKDKEFQEVDLEKFRKTDGEVNISRNANASIEPNSTAERGGSIEHSVDVNDSSERIGSRGRSRLSVSRSPRRSPLSHRKRVSKETPSRSTTNSPVNARSSLGGNSRSRSMSPQPRRRSTSSDGINRYPPERSPSPHRRRSPSLSFSPSKRRRRSTSRSHRRSLSLVRRRIRSLIRGRSRSLVRRRSRSPVRRRSRSPMWHQSRSPRRYRSRSIGRHRSRSPMYRRSRSPVRRRSRSPAFRRSRSLVRRRSRSPVRRRSRSPVLHRSRSPVRRRSRSPVRRRSRSPVRRRSRSPVRRRSPVQHRSRSPVPRRSRSPGTCRSGSAVPRRSRSPVPRRSRSPVPRRSQSPVPRRSRSPVPRRSRSPMPCRPRSPMPQRPRSPLPHKPQSFVGRRSRTPTRQRSASIGRGRSPSFEHQPSPIHPNRRSPSLLRKRSVSPAWQMSSIAHQKRPPSPPLHRSHSQSSEDFSSPSPVHSRSPLLISRRLPKHEQMCREGMRDYEKRSPPHGASGKNAGSMVEIHNETKSLSRSVQIDLKNLNNSPRKHPTMSHSHKSPRFSDSPPAARSSDDDRKYVMQADIPSPLQLPKEHKSWLDIREAGINVEDNSYGREVRDKTISSIGKGSSLSPLGNNGKGSLVKNFYKEKNPTGRIASRGCAESRNQLSVGISSRDHKTHGENISSRALHVEATNQEESLSTHRGIMWSDRKKENYGHDGTTGELLAVDANDSGCGIKSEKFSKLSRRNEQRDPSHSPANDSDKQVRKRRKHRRSRKEMESDYSSDSQIEERKEAKRRRKEEKKLRKEEKRRRREERRRRREERHAEKRKVKALETASSVSDLERSNDEDVWMESHVINADEMESEKKKLEIELRERALKNLKAKKGIDL